MLGHIESVFASPSSGTGLALPVAGEDRDATDVDFPGLSIRWGSAEYTTENANVDFFSSRLIAVMVGLGWRRHRQ
jgi:hypothetical protein